jgi:hypothetical protein
VAAEETWTLSLKDDVSANALKMASSQDVLTASSNRLRDANGGLLKAGDAAGTALKSASAGVVVGGNAATSAAEKMAAKVPGALNAITGAALTAGSILKSAATGDIRGALDQIGGIISAGVGKVQAYLASLGPYGQAAAAVLGVVTGALQATIGSMLDWAGIAIKMTEGRAAATAAWSALAGGEAAGKTAAGAIGKLGDSLPFAGSQVRAWAQSMLAAGVSASQLEARVKAVASAEALMRDVGGGGAAAENLFKRLAESASAADKFIKDLQGGGRKSVQMLADMGLSVADVAKQLGMSETAFAKATVSGEAMSNAVQKALTVKGAGSLDAMMGSWGVILDKAKGGWMSLLGGLGDAVKPLMVEVRSLFGEFNKGSVLMNTLKPIVTAVFTKLFEWATIATHAIHKGFLMVLVGALTAYIAMRPVINAVKDFMTSATMLQGAKTILIGLAVAAGLMALPFIIGGAAVLIVVAALGALVSGIVYVVGAISNFVASITEAFATAYSAATGAGGSIIDGLVAGVMAGGARFIEALTGLASSGLAAFKGVLGIASPSRVMLEHGEDNIAGAAATGVDRGTDKMDASMSRLGAPPKGGAGAKGKGGGATLTATFNNCNFGEGSEEKIREVIRKVWEELSAEAGAAPMGAT